MSKRSRNEDAHFLLMKTDDNPAPAQCDVDLTVIISQQNL